MSHRLTTVLGWLTLIALLAALWVLFGEDPSKEQGARGERLFPGLSASLDDITELSLTSGEVSATLQKKDDIWQIVERDNFPADTARVAAFLRGLALAERREPKTSNFENLPKLGLGDVATKVVLSTEAGPVAALDIGDEGTRRGGQALTYVFKENDSRAWVVSALAPSEVEPTFWMRQPVLDLNPDTIALVSLGGATLSRAEAGAPVTLDGIADGQKPKPDWQLARTVRTLAELEAADVAAIANPATAPMRTITLARFDGLAVTVELYDRADYSGENDAIWARLAASFDPGFAEQAGTDTKEATEGDTTSGGSVVSDDDPEARAARINARVGGWLFMLSPEDASQLMQSRSDFLEATEEAAEEDSQ